MKTIELDAFLEQLMYQETDKMELFLSQEEYFDTITKIAKEFNQNLLLKESKEGLVMVLKYYMIQFNNSSFVLNDFNSKLFDKDNLTIYERYVIACWHNFSDLHKEIEVACLTHEISYNKLGEELSLDLDKYSRWAHDYSETEKYLTLESKNENQLSIQSINKLKWNGRPAHIAHIIYELVDKGYIDAPKYNGDISYKKLADLCLEIFDIDTTPTNMQKELNPEKNTTSQIKKIRFTIPYINELD